MTLFFALLVAAGALFWAIAATLGSRALRRERFIRQYVFPRSVFARFRQEHPAMGEKECFLVARALRVFFLAHLRAGGARLAMPSKAADALWHAFILDTPAYTAFCRGAFGSYFHHIPDSPSSARAASTDALELSWRLACLEENIAPARATRLPLLFALDAKLGWPEAKLFDLRGPHRRKEGDGGGGSGCSGGSGGDCRDTSGRGADDGSPGTSDGGGGGSGGCSGGGCGGGS